MKYTQWSVSNSGGKVIKSGVGHPTVICTLETSPLKITPQVEYNARLIANAPELMERLKITNSTLKEAIKHYYLGDSGLQIALEAIIKYNEQAITKAE